MERSNEPHKQCPKNKHNSVAGSVMPNQIHEASSVPQTSETYSCKVGAGSEVSFRSSLQGGLKGLEVRGRGDEGLKVEGGFTFERLQRGFSLKPSEGEGGFEGLEGGFKAASRAVKGASPSEGFKVA